MCIIPGVQNETPADDDDFVLDMSNEALYGSHSTLVPRTAEDAADRAALRWRQDAAAGIAYDGALASGLSLAAARRAAARARKETL